MSWRCTSIISLRLIVCKLIHRHIKSQYASYDSLFDTSSTHAMLHDDYSPLHSLPNLAILVQND